jgi:transposase
VHDLLQAGRSQREATEILGLSRNAEESKLDPFKAYINQRWNDDITSAAALHAELAATQGWTGSVQAVERYVRQGLLALEDWLTRVEADDQPELHSFANGIRRDQQAVSAGLALPYSSAAMEGNVNNMIKRQMYGRAAFALLRVNA